LAAGDCFQGLTDAQRGVGEASESVVGCADSRALPEGMRLDLARLPNDPALLPRVVRDLADVLERRDAELAETKARLREAAAVFLCAETPTLRPLLGEVPSRSTDVEPGGDRGADRRIAGEARPRTSDGASSLPALPAIGDLRPGGRRTRPHTLANWVGRATWLLQPLASGSRRMSSPASRCSPTTRRCRCSTLATVAPRKAGCGSMSATTGLRRKIFDVHESTKSPVAADALQKIGELYAIERAIRGKPPDRRRELRQEQAKPRLMVLRTWFEAQLARLPPEGGLAVNTGV
jgi:Transposase IS66 family